MHVDLLGGEEKPMMNLHLTVQTDTELWQVHSPKSLRIGEWANIGLYYYPARGGKSGALEFYKNGERAESSTIPRTAINLAADDDTNPELLFPLAYAASPIKIPDLAQITPKGVFNHFGEYFSEMPWVVLLSK